MHRRAWLAFLALSAGACADARERFEAFEERRALADVGDGGADGAAGAIGCEPPAPGIVSGPALLALDTAMAPGIAIMFWGEIETPEQEGGTAVKFSYKALDASNRRTEVGKLLVVGPYRIGDDGSFNAPAPRAELPGSANAIIPGLAIDSELALHGTICGAQTFYCGTVSGNTYAPFAGPAAGHFGLTLLGSKDEIPERPRFGCDEAALSPELTKP